MSGTALHINSCAIHDCTESWSWNTTKDGFSDCDLWAVFRGNGILSEVDTDKTTSFEVYEGICLMLAPSKQYIGAHNADSPLLVISVHFSCDVKIDSTCAKKITDIYFFKTLLERVVSLYNSGCEKEAECFFEAALLEFYHSPNYDSDELTYKWNGIINEICFYIDSAEKPPTLKELALKYGYSERYIGNKFKQTTGSTISQYSALSRLNKAKTLLISTDMPIAEIAYSTAFYDAAYFSRFFIKQTGKTPYTYRKKYRK